jgi:hypothetical protein
LCDSALHCGNHPHLRRLSRRCHDFVINHIDDVDPLDRFLVEIRVAGKMLSVEPTIDPTAKLHDTRLGAYCEVGARTILHEVTLGDYSYVVNDAQITYTTIEQNLPIVV